MSDHGLYLAITILFALVLTASGPARADQARITELIRLIETKPASMDEIAWKERRRDAVRELRDETDERIGPVMTKIVAEEGFDIIAELAVDVIGAQRFEPAVPTLQRVANDKSRDPGIRQAARRALRKIGADVGSKQAANEDTGGAVSAGLSTRFVGESRAEAPGGPSFEDDTLGATERLTLAVGGIRLAYDTVDDWPSLDGDVQASYERTVDRETFAYRYGGDANVVGGYVDFDGSGISSRALIMRLGGHGDARFYLGDGGLYAVGLGFAGFSANHVFVNRADNSDNVRDTLLFGDLGVVLGLGYGRVLDRGAAVRLDRIQLALKRAGLLGRPITPDLAERIFAAWWALRGQQGAHQHLVVTVTILKDAGVLLGEPDASTTYKILQILTDGQLDHRLAGLDVHAGIGETLTLRDDDVVGGAIEEGRIETLVARARYGRQADEGDQEVGGEAFARLRVLGEDGDPEPWAAVGTAVYRRFFYTDAFDPIGGLEVAAQAGVSDAGLMGSETASLLGLRGGWIWSPNRASWFRLSADVTIESTELFFGVALQARYGFLDVGFIGKAAYETP